MFKNIFLFALLPFLLFAQNDTLKTNLSEIVVSATKTSSPFYTIGNSVSSFSSEEISKRQLNSIVDVLREIPGFSVFQLGGPGMLAYLNTRGSNTNHTLVILDGAELNDPSSPSNAFDFSALNTYDIDRIEIVRGPQSTLYGSDAMAGVINIYTKNGDGQPSFSISSEAGSNSFYRGNLSASGSFKFINYFISAGRNGSDGISAANSKLGNSEKDGYSNNSLSANVNFNFTNWAKLNLLYRYVYFKSNLDQNEKFGDDPNFNYNSEEQIFKAGAAINFFNDNWRQNFSASFVKRFSNTIDLTDDSHPAMSSDNFTDAQRFKFDWQNNIYFIKNNLITLGFETETEKAGTSYNSKSEWGDYSSVFPKQTFTTTSFYAQNQLNISNSFFATIGFRHDNNHKYGGINTFKIAPAYFISSSGTKLRMSYGTGFKAPSLFYLFDPLFGNPDLKPEESNGFDIGIDQFLFSEKLQISATYFNLKFNNMFGFDDNYKTINIAEASSNGVELSASVSDVYGFSVNANYTYTKAIDKSTASEDFNLPLIRRPEHKFFVGLLYSYQNEFNIGAQFKYTGKRDDKDFSNYSVTRVTMPDYLIVNFTASYQILDYLKLHARVENIFDKEYEDVLYYGTLGRSFYAGLNFEL